MRRRPIITRRSVLASALVAALLVAGCAGSGTSTTGTSTTGTGTGTAQTTTATGTGTGTGTGTAQTTMATGTTPAPKKKNVIAWILSLGPGAPDGPPEFTAYRELQQLRCRNVFARVAELDEPARTLYAGAADACLAAFAGRTGRWPRAAGALAEVSARAGELNCMDRAALALLDRLVTAYDEHPGRSFRAAAPGRSKAPPCPAIGALVPDRGTQGTLVRMTGRNLVGEVVGISVVDSLGNSLPAVGVEALDGALEFTMPEEPSSDASASVCVVVRADPDWSADGAMFTYESQTTRAPSTFACPPPEQG